MFNLSLWGLPRLVQVVNNYLNMDLTEQEFLQGEFTGSEIYEALEADRLKLLENPAFVRKESRNVL